MQLSARNHLKGKIVAVTRSDDAHVRIDSGGCDSSLVDHQRGR